jgi:hypothetical protein
VIRGTLFHAILSFAVGDQTGLFGGGEERGGTRQAEKNIGVCSIRPCKIYQPIWNISIGTPNIIQYMAFIYLNAYLDEKEWFITVAETTYLFRLRFS